MVLTDAVHDNELQYDKHNGQLSNVRVESSVRIRIQFLVSWSSMAVEKFLFRYGGSNITAQPILGNYRLVEALASLALLKGLS